MRISDWRSDVCSADLAWSRRAGSILAAETLLRSLARAANDEIPSTDGSRAARFAAIQTGPPQIGRASCRERMCQYVWISVGAATLKKQNSSRTHHTTNTMIPISLTHQQNPLTD